MFVLCPHCQFLVTLDPRSGQPPERCPNCGGAMEAAPAADAPEVDAVVVDAPAEVPVVEVPAEDTTQVAREPFSADAMIAAMAAKPEPRARGKARKRKTTDVPVEPAPAPVAPEPVVRKPSGPGVMERLGTAMRALRPKPRVKPVAAAAEPTPARPRRKASVKPIRPLPRNAATDAPATTDAPEIGVTPIAPAEVEVVAIEVAPIEVAPVEAAPIEPTPLERVPLALEPMESRALALEPMEAAPIESAPTEAAPIEDAPIEPAPIEPAPIEAAPIAPAPIPRTRPTTRAPSFLRTESTTARTGAPVRWPRIAILVGLGVLLSLQLLLAQRDVLARDARWRPTVEMLCSALRCTLPAWRDPAAFTMLARDVRPHPTAPGTLQIAASFRNDARFPQVWPRLVLTLSDVDGRVVGARAFSAREYLGALPTQTTLAAGQTAAISLAVVEPAPGVVSFGFEFR